MPGIRRGEVSQTDPRTTLGGTTCGTFTGVMLTLEPGCHTSRGITARTVPFALCPPWASLSSGRRTATGTAEFSIFYWAVCTLSRSRWAAILPRFHIAECCCGYQKDLRPTLLRITDPAETSAATHRHTITIDD